MKEIKENSASRSLTLSFYTFLSRILGLLRDHYMAVSFGTGWVASAFSVAYRLPNMFRNLLAEGTLSQSFMPLYVDAGKSGKAEASKMAGVVISFVFFLLCVFVGLFMVFAPYFIPYLVGGTQKYSNLVIELSLILFVLIMTASIASIYMAISNSKHKFFVPSLSPIILNLSYLFVFLVIFRFVDSTILSRIKILCVGIVVGGFLQLGTQVFYVKKLGYAPKINFNWKHQAIKKIFYLMLPAIIGGGFYQISLLVDIFLANYVQNQNPGLGAVVALDYSQRLVQFPTGIIGVALATTTLPSVLNSLKKNESKNIPVELASVISFSLYLTIPASIGFSIMGETIVDSIFYGGKWDHKATATTIQALGFYTLAIPTFSLNKILTSSYYAFKDTKTPLKINMFSFSINICMNLIIIHFMKHAGLALSSATCSLLTFVLLFKSLKKHSLDIPLKPIFQSFLKNFVPTLGLVFWLVFIQWVSYETIYNYLKVINLSHENIARVILVVGIFPSILIYFVLSKVFHSFEFEIIFNKFFKFLFSKK